MCVYNISWYILNAYKCIYNMYGHYVFRYVCHIHSIDMMCWYTSRWFLAYTDSMDSLGSKCWPLPSQGSHDPGYALHCQRFPWQQATREGSWMGRWLWISILPMVNSPLIRPYVLGGGSFGGSTLGSHDHEVWHFGSANWVDMHKHAGLCEGQTEHLCHVWKCMHQDCQEVISLEFASNHVSVKNKHQRIKVIVWYHFTI